jgi:hypothetical protein
MADTPSDEQVLAAVAEGEADMEALLSDSSVRAPVFGAEAEGQDVMRRAFGGHRARSPSTSARPAALRASAGAASPFSWDVAGKASVVARWPPAARAAGR